MLILVIVTVHKDSLQFNFGLIISILYRAYGLNVIELTAFLMQLIDTCREGDGERSIINQKRLLMYFKSSTSFKNYSIEMFTWIAQIKALVSEEMAHRLTWGPCLVVKLATALKCQKQILLSGILRQVVANHSKLL